jgi:hypothetical protein
MAFQDSAASDHLKDTLLPSEAGPSEDHETTEIEDTLASYIRDRFSDALFHRRRLSVEQKLLKCMRSMRMQYTPEEMELFKSVDIYPGLSSLKARAGEAWINDILLNSLDKPWTINPTPQPDLPQWMKDQIVQQLETEIQQAGMTGIDQVKLRARDLKDAAYQDAQEMSQHSCDNMEHLIEDQLLEGDWRETFAAFVADLMVFLTAMIRAPVVENVQQMVWENNKPKVVEKALLRSRRIDPFDAFPSPDSTTTQNGHYFIERARLTPETLFSAIGIPGFREDSIRFVLERYKNGYIERTTEDSERRRLEYRETPLLETRTLDTIIYNGKVKGSMLLQHGVVVSDPQRWYEVEVWTIANWTIRAVINPSPLGTRPVYGTSYKKNNGSFWGESVISLLFDTERSYNSFIRAALKNAAFSAGPIGEVDTSRLGDDDKPSEIDPYKLYHVNPDMSGMGSAAPAFRFQVIPSTVKELLEGASYFYKLADDISGIPSYVMGNPQVQGGGRTLGGLSMLMGNAAKGIKAVALHIDEDVIEPIVTAYYNYNMLTSNDPDIKADAKVLARGASGLLQRELAQSKMTDILQLLTPYATAPMPQGGALVPPDTIRQVISEVLKSTGMNIQFPNPNQGQQLVQDLQGVGIDAAMQRGVGQPQPLPPQSVVPSQKPSPINLPQGS